MQSVGSRVNEHTTVRQSLLAPSTAEAMEGLGAMLCPPSPRAPHIPGSRALGCLSSCSCASVLQSHCPRASTEGLGEPWWWGDVAGIAAIQPGPLLCPPRSCSHLPTDLLRGPGAAQLPPAAIQGARLASSASPQLHWHLGLQHSSCPPPPARCLQLLALLPTRLLAGLGPSPPTPPQHRCPTTPPTPVPSLPVPHHRDPRASVSPRYKPCPHESGALPGRCRQGRLHSGLSPVLLNEASLAGSSCSQPRTLQRAALPSPRAPLPVWLGPGPVFGAWQKATSPRSPPSPHLNTPSPTRAFLPLCHPASRARPQP